MSSSPQSATPRSVVLVSPDNGMRSRLRNLLTGMRWHVQEASGGAEAMAFMDEQLPEAVMVDSWLPDLEVSAFNEHLRQLYPQVDLLSLDGAHGQNANRSPRRNELLHALREIQETDVADGAAWNSAPVAPPSFVAMVRAAATVTEPTASTEPVSLLPGIVGESTPMRQLARMVRLVAPRSATVLIEGETGTGKELVARAVHLLSERSSRPFAVLNCAAIPESLLEAELFGHTRGAFTGAVQSRTGRIEAANGGTLFLDEIGEMPLPLQAKMLRFLESGELQRVGDNEVMRVDVRVVAATHQPLEQRSTEGRFRTDLYHRLAVFPVEVPPLRERMEDLPMLVQYMLEKMGETAPIKRISSAALEILQRHHWPGNVRELGHVVHRAAILCDERPEIHPEDIRIRMRQS
ncbi:MAG: sigma-54-dependent Fis family transcriptional regulator [Acidobacteria bacterium]|nr:sigma-54-dependent Fis family transcriptional regulator [Acidobacteriota bacterium]